MITVFNRRELLTTANCERQARVRELLAEHGIAYRVRVRSNFSGGSRSRTVLPGTGLENMYQYYIYVNKADYDKAKYMISK